MTYMRLIETFNPLEQRRRKQNSSCSLVPKRVDGHRGKGAAIKLTNDESA
jgi:hypothetical protein